MTRKKRHSFGGEGEELMVLLRRRGWFAGGVQFLLAGRGKKGKEGPLRPGAKLAAKSSTPQKRKSPLSGEEKTCGRRDREKSHPPKKGGEKVPLLSLKKACSGK